MASGFAKLPGFCPTYPIDAKDYKRVSAKKQEENKDVKNKQPTLYPLPREQKPEVPDQKGMNNPNYMSTTHDIHRPKNVDHDIAEQFQPSFVKMDRHTLRFSGYFKETVVESKIESNRTRIITILYYLEDNSIQLIEPKLENSGIPQGAFLKRQKVLRSDNSGYFLGVEDFFVGHDVMIFGKNIHICDCDQYTREFYGNLGKQQGPAESVEKDSWTEKTINKPIPVKDHQMKDYIEHKLGGGKITSAKQFLENDRKVLKFYAFSQLPYILHYYLADDTIEIREVHFQNDGRDPAPLMLRRQKLPQKFALNQPGQIYQEEFTKPEDIKYGGELNVFGRKFQILGCDPFTQQYYREKYNIDFPLGKTEEPKQQEYPSREIPPYNGFGDEVDSLGYVYRLIPKAPNKDFFKWVDNQVFLRFMARLNTDKPEDIDRRFIITYFLNDDGLQVYEPQQRNSGIKDGKFLEKNQYKNVNNNNKIFQPTDLVIDSDILINGFSFHLMECDDFTKKWFQNNLTIKDQQSQH